MSKLRWASRYSKGHSLVSEVALSFYIEGDIGLGVRVYHYAIETGCKVEDMEVSVSQESQLFCTNVTLRDWGNFSDFIDSSKVLAHAPFNGRVRLC